MKKVKILTIALAILLVTLIAFGGIYVQTQNRMENKVKDYELGRELNSQRVIELKIKETSDDTSSDDSEEEKDASSEEGSLDETNTNNTQGTEESEEKTTDNELTEKEKEISQYIVENFGYGVTVFNAVGGYSNQEKKILIPFYHLFLFFIIS